MENRTSDRQRVLKAQLLSSTAVVSTAIRNIPATGALLDVTSPVGIPEYFSLGVPVDRKHLSCRVVSAGGKRIGVTFR